MTLKQALFIQMSTRLLNMIEDYDDFNYVAAKSKEYLSSCNSIAKEWGLDLDEDLDTGDTAAATQMFNYIMQGGKIEN